LFTRVLVKHSLECGDYTGLSPATCAARSTGKVAVDTSTLRSVRFPLKTDGEPIIHPAVLWRILVRGAIIGIFLLLLIPFLESARAILMPVLAAVVVGTMLAPLTSFFDRHGIPSVIYATLAVRSGFCVGCRTLFCPTLHHKRSNSTRPA
jgi:hypothetical protein